MRVKVFGVMILIKSSHEGAEAPVTGHPLDMTETNQASGDEVTSDTNHTLSHCEVSLTGPAIVQI